MARDLPCADCGQMMWRSAGSLPEGQAACRECRRKRPSYKPVAARRSHPERECNVCSKTYQPRRHDSRFCSARCHSRRPRSQDGKIRACEVCGVEYGPSYNGQRTCGRACGKAINAQLQRAKSKTRATAVSWRECKSCASPYTAQGRRRCGCDAPRSRVFVNDCQVCGQWFCSRYTTSTCSELCAESKRRADRRRTKDKRRAMKREAYRADVSPAKIYKRDGHRCRLCNKRLNMRVVVPHPMAATIDHIVPLAQGGLHEPANAQAAHFLCNSLKGHRGGNEQLLLIG